MPSQFTHLHFHTHYSLLDGAIKVKGLGNFLSEIGYDACAITDHGNLHGVVEFHDDLKKAGIKPIIGMEAYIAKIDRFQRSYPKLGPNAYHTVLICQNMEGVTPFPPPWLLWLCLPMTHDAQRNYYQKAG